MREQLWLGAVPAEEEPARGRGPGYEARARAECQAYLEAIRMVVGAEPAGAELRVERPPDGGRLEVVYEYDPADTAAAGYAARYEAEAPATWAAAGMAPPGRGAPAPGPTGKTYIGTRTPDECVVVVVASDGREKQLDPRFDLRRHGEGFGWGYGGSGPAQLALAILADALGDDEAARRHYQQFKRTVVARLADDGFTLTQDEIRTTVAELAAARGNGR